MTPCSLVSGYRRWVVTYCQHVVGYGAALLADGAQVDATAALSTAVGVLHGPVIAAPYYYWRSYCQVSLQGPEHCRLSEERMPVRKYLHSVRLGAHTRLRVCGALCAPVFGRRSSNDTALYSRRVRDTNCDAVKVSESLSGRLFLGNVGTHIPDYAASFKGPRY